VKVLLYCRTTIDSRLAIDARNEKIFEKNKFSLKWKKLFTSEVNIAFSEVFRKASKLRVKAFFKDQFNQELWNRFIKSDKYQEKKEKIKKEEFVHIAKFLTDLEQKF